ncbi:MAG TPA: hypothetical protein VJ717_21015 [Gemmatimonadaceae bacterium]|nr:hypothetical protein [Gemmatimonadaceae bacterium]
MSIVRQIVAILAICALNTDAIAQGQGSGRAGKRLVLARDFEIALARSAAPKSVSDSAEILVLTDTGYVVAVRGKNGNACLVDRSWPESLEPHCFDAEARGTVMQAALLRGAMLQQGATHEAITRAIDEGLRTGRLRTPTRPAMTYMMSAAQVLYNEEGKRVGAWQPHLMIYYPHLTSEQLGLGTTPSTDAAVVVDAGKPWSNIMIVVKKAVAVEGHAGTR